MSLALVQDKVAQANRTNVARAAGLTRNYVSLVLNGKREPSFDVAAKLARHLGITLDELYSCWANTREAA
jgi:transcriptional regulator with XRE-family HTH domain